MSNSKRDGGRTLADRRRKFSSDSVEISARRSMMERIYEIPAWIVVGLIVACLLSPYYFIATSDLSTFWKVFLFAIL